MRKNLRKDLINVKIDRFKIIKLLGSGSWADVYQAFD